MAAAVAVSVGVPLDSHCMDLIDLLAMILVLPTIGDTARTDSKSNAPG